MTPDLYPRLNALGDRLRTGLREVFAEMGVPAQVTGVGSVFSIHFTEEEVWDYPGYLRGRQDGPEEDVHGVASERGLYDVPRAGLPLRAHAGSRYR